MSDTIFDRNPSDAVDLSKYDEEFRRAKYADLPAFKPVPDGKYQVVVETVELTKTRTTGNPMLKWRLRIAGPAMADRILWKNQVITERSMTFVAKEFKLCGLNMDSLSELPARLPDLANLRLEVTKRSRTEGPDDVYFDRNLTAVAVQADADPYHDAEAEDPYDDVNDDLPF